MEVQSTMMVCAVVNTREGGGQEEGKDEKGKGGVGVMSVYPE